jgi:SsrA-binding protein
MAKKKSDRPGSITKNRKASFEYTLEERFEAGIVITGAEIKSIRAGKVSISEAYCFFDGDILKIKGMYINEFKNAGYVDQNPNRDKLLLLKKTELKKIRTKINEKGLTLIPTEVFISEKGFAKIEIALAKGKNTVDKRQSLKEKDVKREVERY